MLLIKVGAKGAVLCVSLGRGRNVRSSAIWWAAIWWWLCFVTSRPTSGEVTGEKVEGQRDPGDRLPSGPRLWALLQGDRQGLGYMGVT